MTKFDAHEFGNFINGVKEDIRQIENGSQVFNGMMHKDRVVSEFNQIVRVIEIQSELMTKYVIENERLAEIGRATVKAFESNYTVDRSTYDYTDESFDVLDCIASVEELLDWAKED